MFHFKNGYAYREAINRAKRRGGEGKKLDEEAVREKSCSVPGRGYMHARTRVRMRKRRGEKVPLNSTPTFLPRRFSFPQLALRHRQPSNLNSFTFSGNSMNCQSLRPINNAFSVCPR